MNNLCLHALSLSGESNLQSDINVEFLKLELYRSYEKNSFFSNLHLLSKIYAQIVDLVALGETIKNSFTLNT